MKRRFSQAHTDGDDQGHTKKLRYHRHHCRSQNNITRSALTEVRPDVNKSLPGLQSSSTSPSRHGLASVPQDAMLIVLSFLGPLGTEWATVNQVSKEFHTICAIPGAAHSFTYLFSLYPPGNYRWKNTPREIWVRQIAQGLHRIRGSIPTLFFAADTFAAPDLATCLRGNDNNIDDVDDIDDMNDMYSTPTKTIQGDHPNTSATNLWTLAGCTQRMCPRRRDTTCIETPKAEERVSILHQLPRLHPQFPGLTSLTFCVDVTGDTEVTSLQCLGGLTLPSLTTLDISAPRQCLSGWMAELCSVSLPNVERLLLSRQETQSKKLDQRGDEHSPRRVLSRCHDRFVPWTLNPDLLPKLENLSLGQWPVCHTQTLCDIARDFPGLTALHLHKISPIPPTELLNLVCPASFPRLGALTIGGVYGEGEQFFAELLGHRQSVDISPGALAKPLRKWPHLKELTLEWLGTTSNVLDVIADANGFAGLERLTVRGVSRLRNFWGTFMAHPTQFAQITSLCVEFVAEMGIVEVPLPVVLPHLRDLTCSHVAIVPEDDTGARRGTTLQGIEVMHRVLRKGTFHPKLKWAVDRC
jgi:hypothetical protein